MVIRSLECLLVAWIAMPAIAAAAPGDLDPSFGLGGKGTTSFPGFGQPRSRSVAIDASGRVVVAGYRDNISDLSFVRYDSTGQLDASFGDNGRVVLTDVAYSAWNLGKLIAIQPDGKIVAGARSPTGLALVRLDGNGALDASFGSGGIATTSSGSDIKDIELLDDGRIVALGWEEDNAILARFDSAGTLDPGFSGDGIALIPQVNSGLSAIAIQDDGKIVAVGFKPMGDFWDFYLTRYSSDGTVDSGFGTAGVVTTDFASADDEARAVAIQPDGAILVTGRVYTGLADSYDNGIARYHSDGSLDTSFSGDGLATTAIADQNEANALVLQADGSIVVAGWATDEFDDHHHNYMSLVRYDSTGNLDASFGNGGIVLTELDASEATDLALQGDGRLVATGPSIDSGFIAVRYQAGACVPDCGNSVIGACESCDDGNLEDGDGCDSNCTRSACGNGIVAGDETCDDANGTIGDGCDLLCRITGCGSGSITIGEECDDGNLDEGDGCDSNCTSSGCGNGIAGGEETCDDGNAVAGDGCEPDCTLTPVSETATAGQTITTDVGGGGVSAGTPLRVDLITPNPGEVSISQAPAGPTPDGYAVLGFALQIEAPVATAEAPLVLVFTLDASVLPQDVPISEIVVLRDGEPMTDCSGAPGTASPDPCVSSRVDVGGGDAEITVLTSHASLWTTALGALGKPATSCLGKIHSTGLKVAAAQLKLNQTCVKGTARGDAPDTDACVIDDAAGKVDSAIAATLAAEEDCASPPRLGFEAVAMIDAAQDDSIVLLHELFGADVSAAIVPNGDDHAMCQSKVLSAMGKYFLKAGQTWFKCVKAGLSGRSTLIVSADGLQGCMNELDLDVGGVLAAAEAKVSSAIARSCDASALESILPGPWSFNCGLSPQTLCLTATAPCRACRMLGAMAGISYNCDLFDDGRGNDSCG